MVGFASGAFPGGACGGWGGVGGFDEGIGSRWAAYLEIAPLASAPVARIDHLIEVVAHVGVLVVPVSIMWGRMEVGVDGV